jgi:hypothetical protein
MAEMEQEQPRNEPENEGEGSRSGDAEYRAGVEEHLRKADVQQEAEQARKDVEASPEEYRKAEEEGKAHSAGELKSDAEGI